MEEDITKKPLVEIITEMTRLDQQIDLKQLKIAKLKLELKQLRQELKIISPQYEELRLEVVRRFPFVEEDEAFKPKQKKI